MKVVHNSIRALRTANEWLQKARQHEQDKEWEDAATAYEKVIQANPANELAYQRLMILYRRKKALDKEIAVINKGIKTFTKLHLQSSRLSHGKKVTTLSKALSKATGLLDKKGRSLYAPEPVGKWIKRKELLEKRTNK